MKGFEITCNRCNTTMVVKEGLLTIHINDVNGKAFIYVGSVEYDEQKRNVWYNSVPIKSGDKIEIKMVETDNISEPETNVTDKRIKRPISKLEAFYQLEALLKEKGLL